MAKDVFLKQIRSLQQTINMAEEERGCYEDLARQEGATEREIEEARGF